MRRKEGRWVDRVGEEVQRGGGFVWGGDDAQRVVSVCEGAVRGVIGVDAVRGVGPGG